MANTIYSVIGANDYSLATTSFNNASGLQITIPASGSIDSATAAIKTASGTHSFTANLYTDSAGTRGSVIGTSGASTNATASYVFRTANFSALNVSAGTYWIQITENTGNPGVTNLAYDTGGAANSSYFLQDNGIPQYGTNIYSQYVTYTPNSVAGGFVIVLK